MLTQIKAGILVYVGMKKKSIWAEIYAMAIEIK
jgi:urea transporter